MKFGVVIGNPPYNDDIYIDFVNLGFELCKDYTIMITPAKWQAKGGVKNELFRKNIVPHMSKIVYYPDETDVFDISLPGGVSYYIIDKAEHNDKYFKIIENNTEIERVSPFNIRIDITDEQLNILNKVLKLGEEPLYKNKKSIVHQHYIDIRAMGTNDMNEKTLESIRKDGSGVWYVDTKRRLEIAPELVKGKSWFGKYHVLSCSWLGCVPDALILKNNECSNMSSLTMYECDSLSECESYSSYIKCKLIWYLVYGFHNGSLLNQFTFRLVPDPGPFDHIFTDEELYKKYGLTDEEINIIESVIKERKYEV